MSYQVKRFDPYGITHPMVPVAVIGGAVLGGAGVMTGKDAAMYAGGILLGLGVVAATKVVVSAVWGTLGLLSGFVTFVVLPNSQTVDQTFRWKVTAAILFGIMYLIVMDALVLGAAVLYNFYGAILGGFSIDLEEAGAEEA